MALGLPAGLVSIVVMLWVQPKSAREWGMALVTTFCSSVFGGAFVVRYFGWQGWVDDFVGLTALGGLMFACGLPGWVLVRAMFAFFDKRKGQDIVQLARSAKDGMSL
ncbi:MAG: hypothetical protein ACRCWC_06545 [Plesiomonas shigelloides]